MINIINPIQDRGGKKQFPSGVEFQVLTKCQSQIIEPEPRPPLENSGFLVKSLQN